MEINFKNTAEYTMNKFSSLSSWLLLSASAALIGCGGGGGGGSNPPPVVSSAAVSSAPASISSVSSSSASSSSVAPLISLTIKGKAVAEALAGGDVVFSVGEKTFSASINDKHEYQVEMVVTESVATAPFTAIATGVGNNAWVQLAAAYPSIAHLASLAGTDKVLDANEYIGVNISAVTTAEYSLLQERDSSIATDTERNYVLLGLDTYLQLQRVSFLSSILSRNERNEIGAYTTTLALLSDKEAISSRLKILKARNDLDWQKLYEVLNDPEQVNISAASIAGTFLVKSDTSGFMYWLTLNANGSGHILVSNNPVVGVEDHEGKNREADITWSRTGKVIDIKPVAPLNFGKGSEQDRAECWINEVFNCDTKISAFTFSLIAKNDVGFTAEVSAQVDLVTAANAVVQSTISFNAYMQLQNQQYFYPFTAETLAGAEWYTNTSRFVFNANGTATRTNLVTHVETAFDWQIQNGLVKTKGGALLLVPLYPHADSYAVVELKDKSRYLQISDAFAATPFIKKQSDASMTAADWVGRWNRITNGAYVTTLDFYENGKFRDGFETQANGSWSVIDTAHMSGVSNGEWRFEYELLAIQNGVHHFVYCGGIESTPFVPASCTLDAYAISKTFTGNLFWETWSKPYFQDSTKAQWRFDGHKLYRGFDVIAYQRIAPNKLYHFESDTVLEMRSSTLNSIEVCEYDADSSCESGTVYQLERGLEIKLNKTGNGALLYSMSAYTVDETTVYGSSLQAKDRQVRFRVEPASGYQMTTGNISGCDGSLVNNYYEIPARQTDCEITANFTPAP